MRAVSKKQAAINKELKKYKNFELEELLKEIKNESN